jgi:hypothetical protein
MIHVAEDVTGGDQVRKKCHGPKSGLLQWLANSVGYLDIHGWSYGGYLSLIGLD